METAAAEPEAESLGVHDCWRYLRSRSVGRLAFMHGEWVEIFPVNYVPSNGTLLIRTGARTKLDAVAERKAVSLEADGLNQYGTIAWSIVVKGHAAAVSDEEDFEDAAEAGLSPLQAGPRMPPSG
ncbi:pyridoxamine 5'-phosphate oxidase family protein [Pseudarthrobacter sp. NamB4]|uniref:pyridoxamine 5'-phosphate oxidase family protein n=1 Tax=Pseudarthrobacter sp. NamB4 TaxID=2576837 RepID=UPI00268BE157